jgi:polyhydroxybutyrate depolymerase
MIDRPATLRRQILLTCAVGASGLAHAEETSPAVFGLSRIEIVSAGQIRHVALYIPSSYRGDRTVPLVLDLHATGITPEVELQITGMDGAAEREGFIVALPVAATRLADGRLTWNVPHRDGVDDVAFVAEVLDLLLARYRIDPARVYATGFSGGARLASALACRLADRFAAISVVGGLQGPDPERERCSAPRAVPLLAFHSIEDPVNPFDGDPRRSPGYWTHGIDEAIARWRVQLGCGSEERRAIGPGIEERRLLGCTGAEVTVYVLRGSGHTWPRSRFAFPEDLGPVERAVDATALTLAWFRRFALPPR